MRAIRCARTEPSVREAYQTVPECSASQASRHCAQRLQATAKRAVRAKVSRRFWDRDASRGTNANACVVYSSSRDQIAKKKLVNMFCLRISSPRSVLSRNSSFLITSRAVARSRHRSTSQRAAAEYGSRTHARTHARESERAERNTNQGLATTEAAGLVHGASS